MLEERRVEVVPPLAVSMAAILVEFFDATRRACTMREVNCAAGVARQELLDLAEDCCDHLRDLFEAPSRDA